MVDVEWDLLIDDLVPPRRKLAAANKGPGFNTDALRELLAHLRAVDDDWIAGKSIQAKMKHLRNLRILVETELEKAARIRKGDRSE